MDTAVRPELKKGFHKFPTSENSEAFGKHRSFFRYCFFYEHFNGQFTEVVFLSKKILYQYFVFCPAWDSFSSENILYVIT